MKSLTRHYSWWQHVALFCLRLTSGQGDAMTDALGLGVLCAIGIACFIALLRIWGVK
jgi:hypothetical protein